MMPAPAPSRDLLLQTIRACEAELAVCQLNIAMSRLRVPAIQQELQGAVATLQALEKETPSGPPGN